MSPEVKHKRGDTREDGMRFWCYNKASKGGEYWVPPDKFDADILRSRRHSLKYSKTDKGSEYRERRKQSGDLRAASLRYAYSEKGKKRKKAYRRAYMKERRTRDPLFRLAERVRGATKRAANLAGEEKPSRSFGLLGADLEIFKSHIESQFTDGMCWERLGEIHLDHIIPLSSGKTPEEIWKLAHYTNLQPLWAADNIRKGAKMPDQLIN